MKVETIVVVSLLERRSKSVADLSKTKLALCERLLDVIENGALARDGGGGKEGYF